ncbi:MAG TPA: sigma factor-like helix-turn-helix DNA-binding protein [Candidatus Dormibacteraeota bacterium]|nr:sigma factor-like helix-turn-helix DNA-binding protein [Candidatus Dormibacteraeota bacterium]
MALDIDRRHWLLALLDNYGELLTDHQRETLNLHLARDWSYAEIADAQGVSRTAVYDLVHRSAAVLEDYENKLGLLATQERRERDRRRLTSRLEGLQGELSRLRKTVKELT